MKQWSYKRIICILGALIMCLSLLASCKNTGDSDIKGSDMSLKAKTVAIDSSMRPVSIVNSSYAQGGISYKLPKVINTGHDNDINAKIKDRIASFAKELPKTTKTVDYSVMYNDRGILSILVSSYNKGEATEPTRNIALNINIAGATPIPLSDVVDLNNADCTSTMVYYINSLAAHNKIQLYSEITDLSGASYYLTDDSLVIFYPLYAIATYSAGEPAFKIPYTAISNYIKTNSVIGIIKSHAVTTEQ